MRGCAKIRLLNRGADEQKYPLRSAYGTARQKNALGKGYLRRSAISHLALGIRVNTRVTVTVREVLFTLTEFFGARFVCTAVGVFPRLLFLFCSTLATSPKSVG